ncbi:hypothetical protein Tco_1027211 [Tanacetum coccineum]
MTHIWGCYTEGKEYPFDLSKPLPFFMNQGRQVVPVDFFINNDLEYLKGGSSTKKYTTSTKKQRLLSMIFQALKTWFHHYGVRLMHSDELYKFSDGRLTSVRFVLHDIASNLRMDYLPKRRWSNLDRKRSRIMIKAIDKVMLERRLMRSLEKFVGGRQYREDFRLLERTI